MSTMKQILKSEKESLNKIKDNQTGFGQQLPYICTVATMGLFISALTLYQCMRIHMHTRNKQRG